MVTLYSLSLVLICPLPDPDVGSQGSKLLNTKDQDGKDPEPPDVVSILLAYSEGDIPRPHSSQVKH